DMDSVLFRGTIEEGRSILVKIIYQNKTGRDIRMTLPDRTTVLFPNKDTIRLSVTRKYAQNVLDSLLQESGVRKQDGTHVDLSGARDADFGVDLVVLSAGQDASGPERSMPERSMAERSLADDIWQRY